MKLRNKKTGEIIDIDIIENRKDGSWEWQAGNTLHDLNKEWEDYKPAEPLIKDEKIRKVVRSWAEANGLDAVKVYEGVGYIGFEDGNGHNITFKYQPEFGTEAPQIIFRNLKYSIAELCGEEKECES